VKPLMDAAADDRKGKSSSWFNFLREAEKLKPGIAADYFF